MEDREIIEEFFQRDEDALRHTSEKYGQQLYRIALHYLFSPEDAQECVNDTCLAAWNAIPPVRPQFFFAWLAKVCRRTAFNRLDWKTAQKRQAVVVELTAEMEACIPGNKAETSLESSEIGALLDQFLASLPSEKRILFMRRYWYGDSIRDLAERTGRSEGSLKTALHRMRKALKTFLEKEGYEI